MAPGETTQTQRCPICGCIMEVYPSGILRCPTCHIECLPDGGGKKYITVGRHRYTPRQQELLRKAGLMEEVAKVEHVQSVDELITKAKELGAAIVVQALPSSMKVELVNKASKEGIEVYDFEVEGLTCIQCSSPEEAEKIAKEMGADIVLFDHRNNNARLSRTKRLCKLVRIEVVKEVVAE